jgi:hypothetical protein
VKLNCLVMILLGGLVMTTGCKSSRPGGKVEACALPQTASLAVGLDSQELDNWCWAASGQMVMKNLGQEVSQCSQANDEFHLSSCCPSAGASDDCNRGGWPEFEKHQIRFQRTSSQAISFADLQKQIACQKHPVAFSWKWVGGGGHMMVAVGYAVLNGTNYVEVNDPWKPFQGSHYFVTYEEYVAAPNHHDHWDDFFGFGQ